MKANRAKIKQGKYFPLYGNYQLQGTYLNNFRNTILYFHVVLIFSGLYDLKLNTMYFIDAREGLTVCEERLRGSECPAPGRASQAVQLVPPAPAGLYRSLRAGPAGVRQPEIPAALRYSGCK